MQRALRKKKIEYGCLRITDFFSRIGDCPKVRIGEESLDDFECILVRGIPGGSLEQIIFRMDVLHRLENLGVGVINSAESIEKTVDKYYTLSLLEDEGIKVPKTICTESREEAMEAFLELKEVVVKPLFGAQGAGIVRIFEEDTAYNVFRALELGNFVYYIQEFIPHKNEDFRVFVLNGEVVSSIKRISDSWKTNVSRGAKVKRVELSEELENLCLRASEILGCFYCGVDVLESDGIYYFIELNSIPAWRGLQKVTGFNLAERIVDEVLEIS